MVLFILFNGGDLSKSQWLTHPFDNTKTDFLKELHKIGKVYTYNPIFYNFNKYNNRFNNSDYDDNIHFKIKDINLNEHCRTLYNKVKEYDSLYILIAHSRGYFFASKFAELYKNRVKYLIVIEGQIALQSWLTKWLNDDKVQKIKHMTDIDLNKLLDTIKNKKDNEHEIRQVSQIVKYHTYKQYDKLTKVFSVPTYFFNNLDDNDDSMKENRIQYDKMLQKNNSQLYIKYYHNKSHFLYFDETYDIINEIKLFVKNLRKEESYYKKYLKYKTKYITL